MERCSPEICAEIFRFACRDDGTTGRALSLVSTYIHDTSSLFMYQSLAVRGPRQIVALASVLERISPDRRRVHDLSISIDLRPFPDAVYADRTDATVKKKMYRLMHSFIPGKRNRREKITKEVRKEAKTESARQLENGVAQAFLRILELVSPTLQFLSVSFEGMEFPVFFSTLPHLRQLSIAHAGTSSAGCILSLLQPLPSLQRLNLRLLNPICTPRQLIGHIAKFAPNVTHLCLPVGYGKWQDRSVENDPLWDGTEEPQLPCTIECILVQPYLPMGYMSTNGWSLYKSGLDRFRQLAIIDNRVTVLQPAMCEG